MVNCNRLQPFTQGLEANSALDFGGEGYQGFPVFQAGSCVVTPPSFPVFLQAGQKYRARFRQVSGH